MNTAGKRQHFPQETHLLDSQRNNKQPTKSRSAEAAATMGLDDYGECDRSLASYKRDSMSSQAAFSLEEAYERLYERLKEYPPFTKSQTIERMIDDSCTQSRSFVFTAGHNLRISVQIRSDVQRILFSTVVHKLNYQQQQEVSPQPSRGYSLLTKMMKYNSILGRATGGGQVVCTSEGSFVFFQDVNMMGALCCTTSCCKLSVLVDDFVLKAMEIRRDFMRTNIVR